MLKKISLLSMLKTVVRLFVKTLIQYFRILCCIDSLKEQHLFEILIFCINEKIFTNLMLD